MGAGTMQQRLLRFSMQDVTHASSSDRAGDLPLHANVTPPYCTPQTLCLRPKASNAARQMPLSSKTVAVKIGPKIVAAPLRLKCARAAPITARVLAATF